MGQAKFLARLIKEQVAVDVDSSACNAVHHDAPVGSENREYFLHDFPKMSTMPANEHSVGMWQSADVDIKEIANVATNAWRAKPSAVFAH